MRDTFKFKSRRKPTESRGEARSTCFQHHRLFLLLFSSCRVHPSFTSWWKSCIAFQPQIRHHPFQEGRTSGSSQFTNTVPASEGSVAMKIDTGLKLLGISWKQRCHAFNEQQIDGIPSVGQALF